MRRYESQIFLEARSWGLQRSATDRLSALELLAALQHQGVPTRLLDFTHNAVTALWFAVQERFDQNGEMMAETDGHVFIAQANGREVPEAWARSAEIPWTSYRADEVSPGDVAAEARASEPPDWDTNIYVWTPPPIDPRMTRQQGCFVFGGVPSTGGGWYGPAGPMQAEQIRACVSVPVRMYSPTYTRQRVARGRPPAYPIAFTFRIPASTKHTLRLELEQGFGYTHAMLYPDFPGFAAFGRSIPRGTSPSAGQP